MSKDAWLGPADGKVPLEEQHHTKAPAPGLVVRTEGQDGATAGTGVPTPRGEDRPSRLSEGTGGSLATKAAAGNGLRARQEAGPSRTPFPVVFKANGGLAVPPARVDTSAHKRLHSVVGAPSERAAKRPQGAPAGGRAAATAGIDYIDLLDDDDGDEEETAKSKLLREGQPPELPQTSTRQGLAAQLAEALDKMAGLEQVRAEDAATVDDSLKEAARATQKAARLEGMLQAADAAARSREAQFREAEAVHGKAVVAQRDAAAAGLKQAEREKVAAAEAAAVALAAKDEECRKLEEELQESRLQVGRAQTERDDELRSRAAGGGASAARVRAQATEAAQKLAAQDATASAAAAEEHIKLMEAACEEAAAAERRVAAGKLKQAEERAKAAEARLTASLQGQQVAQQDAAQRLKDAEAAAAAAVVTMDGACRKLAAELQDARWQAGRAERERGAEHVRFEAAEGDALTNLRAQVAAALEKLAAQQKAHLDSEAGMAQSHALALQKALEVPAASLRKARDELAAAADREALLEGQLQASRGLVRQINAEASAEAERLSTVANAAAAGLREQVADLTRQSAAHQQAAQVIVDQLCRERDAEAKSRATADRAVTDACVRLDKLAQELAVQQKAASSAEARITQAESAAKKRILQQDVTVQAAQLKARQAESTRNVEVQLRTSAEEAAAGVRKHVNELMKQLEAQQQAAAATEARHAAALGASVRAQDLAREAWATSLQQAEAAQSVERDGRVSAEAVVADEVAKLAVVLSSVAANKQEADRKVQLAEAERDAERCSCAAGAELLASLRGELAKATLHAAALSQAAAVAEAGHARAQADALEAADTAMRRLLEEMTVKVQQAESDLGVERQYCAAAVEREVALRGELAGARVELEGQQQAQVRATEAATQLAATNELMTVVQQQILELKAQAQQANNERDVERGARTAADVAVADVRRQLVKATGLHAAAEQEFTRRLDMVEGQRDAESSRRAAAEDKAEGLLVHLEGVACELSLLSKAHTDHDLLVRQWQKAEAEYAACKLRLVEGQRALDVHWATVQAREVDTAADRAALEAREREGIAEEDKWRVKAAAWQRDLQERWVQLQEQEARLDALCGLRGPTA